MDDELPIRRRVALSECPVPAGEAGQALSSIFTGLGLRLYRDGIGFALIVAGAWFILK